MFVLTVISVELMSLLTVANFVGDHASFNIAWPKNSV